MLLHGLVAHSRHLQFFLRARAALLLCVGVVIVLVLGLNRSALAKEIGADLELSELTLVKSSAGKAVVRFGAGPLEVVSVGDKVGRHQAEVKEIASGRVILDEVFTGKDGRPNRAEVILKDGETGGTRYLARPEEEPLPATRPLMIDPKGHAEQR